MRKPISVVVGILCLGIGVSSIHGAQVSSGVGGVPSGKAYGPPNVRVFTPGSLNFDGVAAPCNFIDQESLQSYGNVQFAGVESDGGAILNECGNFLVTGYSAPNFLAFSCIANTRHGGIPQLPERITFPSEVRKLSLKVGSREGTGEILSVIGRGLEGVETHDVTLSSTLQTVSFKKPVSAIQFASSTACVLVVDDLSWR